MPTSTNAEPHCNRTRFLSTSCGLLGEVAVLQQLLERGHSRHGGDDTPLSEQVIGRDAQLVGVGLGRQVPRRRRAQRTRAARACARADGDTRAPSMPTDEPRVSGPRVAIPEALAAFASQTPRDRAAHTRGRAFPDLVAGFAGDFAGAPDLVARPRDAAEVARVLEVCEARGWAVVPFGGGTSVVGGVDAAAARGDREAVVSLDLEALAGVREVDATSRLARIGAGTFGPRLEDELAPHGADAAPLPAVVRVLDARRLARDARRRPLRDRPDAHRRSLSRARARHAARHDRDALAIPPSGAGPEPARLVLGSEGALGVITEAWMRVVPRPRWRAIGERRVRDVRRRCRGGARARAIRPATGERAPARSERSEAPPRALRRQRRAAARLRVRRSSARRVARARARARARSRWHGRHRTDREGRATPASAAAKPARGARRSSTRRICSPRCSRSASSSDTFETACTWTAFPALHERVTTAVLPRGVAAVGSSRAASRTSIPTVRRRTTRSSARCARRRARCVARRSRPRHRDAVARRRRHDHASSRGRSHAPPVVRRERPALFADALRASKHALDPNGILNPGVLVGP